MPIAGLVVTLGPGAGEPAIGAELASETFVKVGTRDGQRLAVAVESQSAAAGEAAFERLRRLPGVLSVDLVYLDLSDLSDAAPGS
jgi:nitrate reductase NapAB chaperone NapD